MDDIRHQLTLGRLTGGLQLLFDLREEFGGRVGVHLDPAAIDSLNRFDVQIIPSESPLFLGDNQIGRFERSQMQHYRTPIESGNRIAIMSF
jgi:hypothetical protein